MKSINSLSDMTLLMLCEMNDKAQHLVDLMKLGIVKFMFKKISTGKNRIAHGTLRRDLIPPDALRKRGRPKKRPNYLVIYYDTGKHAIRSFKDELLKKILSGPEIPDNIKDDVEDRSKKKKEELKEDETYKVRSKKHKARRRRDH